jgi:hypothetical protein
MARQFVYFMQGLTKTYPATARCSRTSICRSIRTPRSACSASTAPASRRCCASWPASTRNITARPGSPRARASATSSRSRSSIRQDVRENVMEGVAKQKAILDRYNELAMNYSDETADEMTKLQDEIEAAGPVGSRQQGRPGDGRAALPARRCRRDQALGRRAPPRRAVPAAARPARPAAARRADQPSRRRVGVWLEGICATIPARS